VDPRLAAAAAAQKGLILHSQARAVGLSNKAIRHRVDSGQWVRRARGLYAVAGADPTWQQALLAAVLAAGPRAAAAGRSAAALWRLPGFSVGPVELVSPYGTSHESPLGKVRHSCFLPDHHLTTTDGVRVTRPARTLFDLAAILGPKHVERTLDNAIAMRLTDVEQLRQLLAELGERRRTGTALMRRLLDERGEGYVAPESELEARFFELVDRAGLLRPDAQISLGDDESPVGRVDYVYRAPRAVIELDSRRHHSALLDLEADRRRDNRFGAMGLRVFRITWLQLTRRPDEVVALLRAVLRLAA